MNRALFICFWMKNFFSFIISPRAVKCYGNWKSKGGKSVKMSQVAWYMEADEFINREGEDERGVIDRGVKWLGGLLRLKFNLHRHFMKHFLELFHAFLNNSRWNQTIVWTQIPKRSTLYSLPTTGESPSSDVTKNIITSVTFHYDLLAVKTSMSVVYSYDGARILFFFIWQYRKVRSAHMASCSRALGGKRFSQSFSRDRFEKNFTFKSSLKRGAEHQDDK